MGRRGLIAEIAVSFLPVDIRRGDILDFNRRDLVKSVQPIATLFFFLEPVSQN